MEIYVKKEGEGGKRERETKLKTPDNNKINREGGTERKGNRDRRRLTDTQPGKTSLFTTSLHSASVLKAFVRRHTLCTETRGF